MNYWVEQMFINLTYFSLTVSSVLKPSLGSWFSPMYTSMIRNHLRAMPEARGKV